MYMKLEDIGVGDMKDKQKSVMQTKNYDPEKVLFDSSSVFF